MIKKNLVPIMVLAHFQRVLELDRHAGFTRGVADDLFAMAGIHEQLGEDEAALDCLDRSIKIYALLENQAQVLEHLGRLESLVQKTWKRGSGDRPFHQPVAGRWSRRCHLPLVPVAIWGWRLRRPTDGEDWQ
jgi:hypothetical protein